MKRAFFVIGPEGSGTYMLAEAFVSAGCTYCDKDDVGTFLEEQQPDLLVLRRSLPHAGKWPNIEEIVSFLKENDYSVMLFGIVRDYKSVINSVMRRDSFMRKHDFYKAIRHMANYLDKNTSQLVIYEYFVQSRAYRTNVLNVSGLKESQMEFYDGNAKYYE